MYCYIGGKMLQLDCEVFWGGGIIFQRDYKQSLMWHVGVGQHNILIRVPCAVDWAS